MTHRTEIRETISPGKPLRLHQREQPPPLSSLVPSHPVVSLETSGAYRLSPTKKLVRLPASSPRDKYRADLDKLHSCSPIREKTELGRGLDPLVSQSLAEERTRDTLRQSPGDVRKTLRFEEGESLLRESQYSEHINSHISEAKDVLGSLRSRHSVERISTPAVRGCLEELRTATSALGQIGEVLERTAEILSTSAHFLDSTLSQVSAPGYYRRHEYPHSHRLLHSPF